MENTSISSLIASGVIKVQPIEKQELPASKGFKIGFYRWGIPHLIETPEQKTYPTKKGCLNAINRLYKCQTDEEQSALAYYQGFYQGVKDSKKYPERFNHWTTFKKSKKKLLPLNRDTIPVRIDNPYYNDNCQLPTEANYEFQSDLEKAIYQSIPYNYSIEDENGQGFITGYFAAIELLETPKENNIITNKHHNSRNFN